MLNLQYREGTEPLPYNALSDGALNWNLPFLFYHALPGLTSVRLSVIVQANRIVLQGRVRFPTGGRVRERKLNR